MGKASRDKGRRGQSAARDLLESRDWVVGDLSAGLDTEDLMAVSPEGSTFSVEVKNTVSINVRAFVKQAREQVRKGCRWMVMARIDGFASAWLVIKQGEAPVVWSGK